MASVALLSSTPSNRYGWLQHFFSSMTMLRREVALPMLRPPLLAAALSLEKLRVRIHR